MRGPHGLWGAAGTRLYTKVTQLKLTINLNKIGDVKFRRVGRTATGGILSLAGFFFGTLTNSVSWVTRHDFILHITKWYRETLAASCAIRTSPNCLYLMKTRRLLSPRVAPVALFELNRSWISYRKSRIIQPIWNLLLTLNQQSYYDKKSTSLLPKRWLSKIWYFAGLPATEVFPRWSLRRWGQ